MKSIGKTIVGYRYGKAPESGKSYNYRENKYECGVSMASVGYDKEIGSFAVSGSKDRKKYYYIGEICGTGSDDEICLENVRQIKYNDYVSMRKQLIEVSNMVVNERYDRKLRLISAGWNIGLTEEEVNAERNKHLK